MLDHHDQQSYFFINDPADFLMTHFWFKVGVSLTFFSGFEVETHNRKSQRISEHMVALISKRQDRNFQRRTASACSNIPIWVDSEK